MSISQFVIQIVLTFAAAFLGAFLTRRTEQAKHLRELRSSAYADFLRGFAQVGRAQQDEMSRESRNQEQHAGKMLVSDARARILIYGGSDVVRALSEFVNAGMHTDSDQGRVQFACLCALMRRETGEEALGGQVIGPVLFG